MSDMGCGSGIYLTELCREFPTLHAVGIDPSEGAADAARQHVQSDPSANRITIACSDAVDRMQKNAGQYDLGIICFVIHEILGQRGDEAVDEFLSEYFRNSPDADMMIIDIDHVWADREAMHHPLARNYYNQYFLLHPFTSQRLETAQYWDRKFTKLGLRIVNKATSDPAIDSTGIVMGWHLRRA
jgi:2-ketoarginine methyltransferase